jgi:WD40 repeat protein
MPLGKPLTGTSASVFSVAFSNHGHMMASGGGNSGVVKLWNVADPAHPQLFRQFHVCTAGIVYSVAFSPNSRVLAGGCEDGTVGLWDVADPAHARAFAKRLSSQVGEVFGVAFSPDGRTLASAGNDGTVGLWDVADPARPTALGQPLTASISHIRSVAFGRTGATLATAGGDGTIRLWNLKPGTATKRICAAASNVLTPRLWPTYIPQLPYQAPCPR